jgi:outer membrane protein
METPLSKFALLLTVILVTLCWWKTSSAEDLLTVYRLALWNDAELMIAESNYLAAIEALPLAQSRNRPQVFFNAEGRHIEADDVDTGSSSSDNTRYGLNLTQSLYNYEISGDIEIAEANTRAELALLNEARQSLALRVAQTYFSILGAEDNVDFTYAERTAIARQLEEAQKRFEVGLIAITDVVEAQASFDNSEAQVILAENILENAWQALVVLTADNSIRKLAPLGDDLKLSLPNPITVEAWVVLALNNNLELIAAQENLNAARYERDKNYRNRYPTLDFVASYESIDVDDELLGDTDRDDLTVGIELEIPLYAGGRLPAEQTQAEAQFRAAQNTTLLQSRLTVQQSRTAYLDVVSGISQVKALKQAFKSSQIARDATQAGFEVGTRTSVDVLISLRETYRTQRDYAGARYQYVLNKLRLKQAAGILVEEDIKDANNSLIKQ